MPVPKRKPSNKKTNIIPTRQTQPFFEINRNQRYSSGMRLMDGGIQQIDPLAHYTDSLKPGKKKEPTLENLRAIANTLPGRVAIDVITDGVLQMQVHVEPPKELKDDKQAKELAQFIEKSFRRPNIEQHNSYWKFVSAIVTDLLIHNIAYVERQKSELAHSEQAAWMWAIAPHKIEESIEWTPQKEGILPRYWYKIDDDRNEWISLYNRDVFCIQRYSFSWTKESPPSAIRLAFDMMISWLGLTDYQRQTTSKASQEWILDLGDINQKELEAFREFFNVEVLQNGNVPIIGSKGGKGINVVKMGASTDEGLYLKYQENLLRMIALAFKLSPRDFNIQEHDNRATAGVSADASFQRGILPLAQLIVSTFQLEILDFYFPGYTIEFNDAEPRSEADEAQTTSMLYEKGILTQNEARLRIGQGQVGKEGDKFYSKEGGESTDSEEQPKDKTQNMKKIEQVQAKKKRGRKPKNPMQEIE